MKQEVIKLEDVNRFNDIFGLETLHPMVSVVDLSKATRWPETLTINYGVYAVYLKKTKCGDLTYGMQEYDYDEGTIVCFAPGQVVTSHMNTDTKPEGYGILFHPDFIHGTSLGKDIKRYSFRNQNRKEETHAGFRAQYIRKVRTAALSLRPVCDTMNSTGMSHSGPLRSSLP